MNKKDFIELVEKNEKLRIQRIHNRFEVLLQNKAQLVRPTDDSFTFLDREVEEASVEEIENMLEENDFEATHKPVSYHEGVSYHGVVLPILFTVKL